MHKIKMNYKKVAYLTFVVSTLALIGTWVGEHIFHLKPCVLCLYQRYLWSFTFVFSGILMFIHHRRYLGITTLFALSLLFILNFGVSIYKVGVEQQIVQAPAICKATSAQSMEQLSKQIMETPLANCSQIAWELFGISLAGYNALLNLFMLLVTIYAIKLRFRHK